MLTAQEELKAIGKEIKAVDMAIIESLAQREKLSEKVIAIKMAAGLPIVRPQIEERRLDDAKKRAKQIGYSNPEFARSIIRQAIVESCVFQLKVREGTPRKSCS